MFQNINHVDEQQNENQYEEVENKNNNREFLKKIFSIQNIILYILSFMISTVEFLGGIAPFSLAILAGCFSNDIPIGIIYVLTCIGTLIGFGTDTFLIYLLTSLVFMAVSLMFRTKIIHKGEDEIKKLGLKLFATTFLIQLISKLPGGLLVYEVLESFMFAISACIFYKIFRGCIGVIKDFRIKTAFSVEEVLGASLILEIAVAAFGDFAIFGFSIRNIISILIVLVLGWNNGILVGTTGGVTIGVVLSIISNSNPIMIAAYALSRNGSWNFS